MSIQTDRLIIRPLELDDAPDLFEYMSDPVVTEFAIGYPHQTMAEAEHYVESVLNIYDQNYPSIWGICLKPDPTVISTCGFELYFEEHKRAEIGFAFSKSVWGQGIATEAVSTLIKHGFETYNFNRIEAISNPKSIASQRVLEKCGFTKEGLLKEYIWSREEPKDVYLYRILKSDFK